MLGVEPIETDRDGKAHQIRVQVRRNGVQVRARRQVQYTVRTPNTWSRDVLMGRVLRSPAANTELPMRLSSYVYRDAAPGKVKLVMAAEIDPETMEKGLDLAIGFAVFDRVGTVVASGQERKIYSPNSDLPIRYDLTIAVSPGSYRVRLAAIDLAGNSGSVERDVEAFGMEGQELAFGDLILAQVRDAQSRRLAPPGRAAGGGRAAGDLHRALHEQAGLAGRHQGDLRSGRHRRWPDASKRHCGSAESAPIARCDRRWRSCPLARCRPAGTSPARSSRRGQDRRKAGAAVRGVAELPSSCRTSRLAHAMHGAPAQPDAPVAPSRAGSATGVVVAARPAAFSREDVLTPEMLRAVFDAHGQEPPCRKERRSRGRGAASSRARR